jgi:hypothetical protein
MIAYLDNNVLVDLEDGNMTLNTLLQNVDKDITAFYYSAAHLQEAHEMSGNSFEKQERLQRRFQTLSEITNNNYIYMEYPSNIVRKIIEKPAIVYQTINDVKGGQDQMKRMVNSVDQTKREIVRQQLNVDPMLINNYSPSEVISHLSEKRDVLGGYSFLGLIDYAIKQQGGNMGMAGKVTAVFELLDLAGYWKDKYTEKSNYARLWDSNHSYYASHFDYFISNDKRTRYKANVAFHVCDSNAKAVSAKGEK